MAPSTPVASLATFRVLPERPGHPFCSSFTFLALTVAPQPAPDLLAVWFWLIYRSRSALHIACVVLLAARPALRLPGLPALPRFASRCASRLPVHRCSRSASPRSGRLPVLLSRPCFTRRCVCLPHSFKLGLPLACRLFGCPVHLACLVSQTRAACFVHTLHQAGFCPRNRSLRLGQRPVHRLQTTVQKRLS